MAYHINEELGDIYYEVIGDQLILKIRDGILGMGCDIYIIKEDDATVPSDDTVFSSKRTIQEIENRIPEAGEGGYWEMKEDSSGNKYIYTKYPMVSQYGATFYAGTPIEVGSIYDGLPIDNDTIYWQEYENGVKILKAKGGGEGGTFDSAEMWRLLGASSTEQINSTHLSTALQPYATTSSVNEAISEVAKNFVTTNTEQEISSLKHFLAGLSIGTNKHKIYESNGVLYIEGDLAVTGGVTQYALGDTKVPTIMDGIACDNITIHINPDTKALEVIGGAGGGDLDLKAMWAALSADTTEQINKSHLTNALQGYATTDSVSTLQTEITKKWTQDDAKIKNWDTAFGWGDHASAGYAHLALEETFTGLKHFTANITLGTNKKSIYEKDGVIYIDANLAVTGGITQYSTEESSGGSGGGGIDVDALWEILGGTGTQQINKSHLTDALKGYLTSVSLSTISDLHSSWNALLKAAPSGYVTRWPTISEVTNKQSLVVKLNSGTTEGTNMFTYNATTAKSINITPSAIGAAASSHNHSWANITSGKPNSLAGYGITDAYTKTESDGKYPTKTGGGASGTWGINISGRSSEAIKLVDNGDVTAISGTETFPSGLYLHRVYQNGYPCLFGNLLRIGGIGLGELLAEWANNSSTGHLFYRSKRDVSTQAWSGWKKVAFTDDNVASATKLQTPRTIWGQSFDGTKSINGNLTIGSGNADDKINIYNNSLTDSYCRISNTNTNKTIAFGIGASGINRGLRDISFNKWMIYSDNMKTYLCDNIWINQSAYNNGLHINRTTVNLGAAISFYSNNSGLGIIGINGSKTFEFGVLNGTATDLKFTVDSNGNALARGGITQYSDQRAKTIIEQITLSLKDIAQSPAIRFRWNGWKQKDDGKTHIGGIAQYVQTILPEVIYNSDGAFTMDYATTGYIFAVNTAKHLLDYETKTDKEINKLKKRIKYLEKQLKKLGYEEANIMDN